MADRVVDRVVGTPDVPLAWLADSRLEVGRRSVS